MTNETAPTTRVIKVGGSLLGQPQLPQRLNQFLANAHCDRNIIVAGGGKLVDTVRMWHKIHPISDEWCHQSSVRLMTETARLLSEICGRLPIVSKISNIPKRGNVILICEHEILSSDQLEASWKVTSDSIAAQIANQLNATELWLLKSGRPESPLINEWIRHEWVDECFAQIHDPERPVFILNMAVGDSLPVRGD